MGAPPAHTDALGLSLTFSPTRMVPLCPFLTSILPLPSSFLPAYCDSLFLPFLCVKPSSLIHTLPPPSLPGSPELLSDLRHIFFP